MWRIDLVLVDDAVGAEQIARQRARSRSAMSTLLRLASETIAWCSLPCVLEPAELQRRAAAPW